MKETLELQKKAFIENGQPSYNQRLDSLKRCIARLETHDVQIVEALNEDYKNSKHFCIPQPKKSSNFFENYSHINFANYICWIDDK